MSPRLAITDRTEPDDSAETRGKVPCWSVDRGRARRHVPRVRRGAVELRLALAMASPLAGCASEPPPVRSFEVVLENLDSALFSIWGTSATDVWAVGADDGSGPLVLHYDGSAWTRRATGASGDLWWVSGAGDTIWMSGTNGLVVRYTRSTDAFEPGTLPGASASTIFGIIGLAPADAWAVGGDVRTNVAVLDRWDGTSWTPVTDAPAEALARPLFKVWGRASDDLYVVGLGSFAMHRSGAGFTAIPTANRLLTVHGNASDVLAVGGTSGGYVVDLSSETAIDATPPGIEQLNGVFVRPDGDAITVGTGGAIWVRTGGAWAEVLDVPPTREDYHAAWVDPDGGEWAVGGHIAAAPFDRGILVHRGEPVASAVVEP